MPGTGRTSGPGLATVKELELVCERLGETPTGRPDERWVENRTDETDGSMRLNSPIDSSVARGPDDGLLVSWGCPMGQSHGSDVSSGLRKAGLDPVTRQGPVRSNFCRCYRHDHLFSCGDNDAQRNAVVGGRQLLYALFLYAL